MSNGEINIVNPLELTNNFANILSKSIVATECNLIFKLHKGLQIRDDEDEEKKEFSDTLSKMVGNVTNDLTCTFEYSIKNFEDLKILEFDKLESLPFQVQIYYRDLSGKLLFSFKFSHLFSLCKKKGSKRVRCKKKKLK